MTEHEPFLGWVWKSGNYHQIWCKFDGWSLFFTFQDTKISDKITYHIVSFCGSYHILSHYICTAHTCTKSLLYDNISRMLRICMYIYTVYTLRQSNMAMDTPFMNDFLNETSIYRGISVAKFDFQRVSTSKLPFLGYTLDSPNHWISHYGWFLGTPMT